MRARFTACALAVSSILSSSSMPSFGAGPLVVGEEIHQTFETRQLQRLEPVAPEKHVLRFPRATYIAAHFSRFDLAAGDHVIVRSPDGAQSWRYEGLGRGGLGLSPGGFWSSRIEGESAVVELHRARPSNSAYTIDRFARGFRTEELEGANPSVPTSICGSDDADWAKCYLGSEPAIYEHSRAVARLYIQGTLACSGWLVGCNQHLLTNEHCIGSVSDALNTDYEFLAEGATCQNGCYSLLACPGVIAATTASVVQINAALDFALVRLPGSPSQTYGYLRMRETGPVPDERIYIPQHPEGWGKRIAVHSSHPLDESGFCEVASLNAPPCEGGPGDVGYYADTREGSSGSPVVAYSDHRAVALHHCANCPNRAVNMVDIIAALGPNVPPCALEKPDGSVVLDRPGYSCSDTIEITVEDDSIIGAGSQAVTIHSTSESGPETVVLVEQEPGTFRGEIATTTAGAVGGDGLLTVVHGAILTATYIDADDGLGGMNVLRQATAQADCVGPVISNVNAAGITGSAAHVNWLTDEPADGEVQYGLALPPGSIASTLTLSTGHGILLSGLQSCSTYFFSVSSKDAVQNGATDDMGGLYYSFQTLCLPPPAIPAGNSTQAPVRVRKESGGKVRVVWDRSCPPPLTNALYGPLEQVSTLTIAGSACAVLPPWVWTTPAGNSWFLLVGANDQAEESSWGLSTAGERSVGSASGQCGVLTQNLQASCP